MDYTLTKKDIRRAAFAYRQLLATDRFAYLNARLVREVQSFVQTQEVRAIHTFLPIARNREPDITPLFPQCWQAGIRLVVSRTNFQTKAMQHYYLEPDTPIEVNARGIPEPLHAVEAKPEEVDMVFVPLLVADKRGGRIGYGGGYYDRLLAGTNARKVGLSLSPPVDQIVQGEPWDISLDYLITPFKTYNYG